jgi:hypothetical protein
MTTDHCPTCGSTDPAVRERFRGPSGLPLGRCLHDRTTEADDLPARLVDARTSGGVTAIELRDARIRELQAEVARLTIDRDWWKEDRDKLLAENTRLTALGDALADAIRDDWQVTGGRTVHVADALTAWRNR